MQEAWATRVNDSRPLSREFPFELGAEVLHLI